MWSQHSYYISRTIAVIRLLHCKYTAYQVGRYWESAYVVLLACTWSMCAMQG